MDEVAAYLRLLKTPGLGARKTKLLSEAFGSAEAILSASDRQLLAVEGIGKSIVSALRRHQKVDGEFARAELQRAKNLGIDILAFSDTSYPLALKSIHDPPAVLYVKGDLHCVAMSFQQLKSVAIVGTRQADGYGLKQARLLASDLSRRGIAIVSGLARGIDSAAHEGCLHSASGSVDSGAATIAVLGASLDHIYPRENKGLARAILEQAGALVSEYCIGTAPRAKNFPARNRIIVGLSRACVVIQGGKKSGAMISADYAMEEGRSVFALPGNVDTDISEGPLMLLKQGANVLADYRDILEEFDWHSKTTTESTGKPSAQVGLFPKSAPLPTLSAEEQALLQHLSRQTGSTIDRLCKESTLSSATVLALLNKLSLLNLVERQANGRYVRQG